jgi:hypothetical protein
MMESQFLVEENNCPAMSGRAGQTAAIRVVQQYDDNCHPVRDGLNQVGKAGSRLYQEGVRSIIVCCAMLS